MEQDYAYSKQRFFSLRLIWPLALLNEKHAHSQKPMLSPRYEIWHTFCGNWLALLLSLRDQWYILTKILYCLHAFSIIMHGDGAYTFNQWLMYDAVFPMAIIHGCRNKVCKWECLHSLLLLITYMPNISSRSYIFGLCLLRGFSSEGRNVSHREHNIDSTDLELEISLTTLRSHVINRQRMLPQHCIDNRLW